MYQEHDDRNILLRGISFSVLLVLTTTVLFLILEELLSLYGNAGPVYIDSNLFWTAPKERSTFLSEYYLRGKAYTPRATGISILFVIISPIITSISIYFQSRFRRKFSNNSRSKSLQHLFFLPSTWPFKAILILAITAIFYFYNMIIFREVLALFLLILVPILLFIIFQAAGRFVDPKDRFGEIDFRGLIYLFITYLFFVFISLKLFPTK